MTTTALLIAPVGLPLLAAASHAVFGWRPKTTAWSGAAAAAGLLACAVALAVAAVDRPRTGLGGLLRADALSAYMLVVIGAVALPALLASPGYLAAERAAGHTSAADARRYGILTQTFVAAMALAVLAANLGVLWVAVEATTICTAFLVGHRRTRHATEAAWKYVVICSAGIALAFLGIVLLNFAARHAHVPSSGALDWAELARHATALDADVTRVAVALLVLGFGTKAGLAPLHAWLPDAHSQAPAPVSALMSGVLLSVAFYAVLRVKVIADAALGVPFTRTLLAAVALVSLAAAAALLLKQRDYKRMLAYSSIEHMGLIALGAAVGTPLAASAVLLHILGHGLAKSVAFLASGHIQQATGSTRVDGARGLIARVPLTAGLFGASLAALLGFPPFGLFASELGMFRAGFTAGMGWAVAAALLLMLVVVAAVAAHTGRMLLGAHRPGPGAAALAGDVRLARSAALALTAALVACAALGVTAWPLHTLLDTAAAIIGAHP
ncbi:hydrogenase [Actinomadura sp. NBRC 104425]|uniref:proton-conducting transporter transmembrane domain-containing protein n=1 Tax=Actinomadura sp. NBRC 104425 TaxID=3032204 RepID=UPI0024A3FB55|nr:proton-conducting transporter membrane subunit [Actinomadura sp. NBRC 104425]GLZ14108.1 hydrogenase [Actinomadura sp. NBRC 104425]